MVDYDPDRTGAGPNIVAASDHADHIDLKIRPIGRAKVSTDSVLGFQRVTRRYVVEGPHASKGGLFKSADFWVYVKEGGDGWLPGDLLTLNFGGPGHPSSGAEVEGSASAATGRVTSVIPTDQQGRGTINGIEITFGGALYTKAPAGYFSPLGDTTPTGGSITAVYEPALFRPIGEPDIEYTDHYLVNQQVEPSKSMDKVYLTREFVKLRDTWYAESSSESGNLKRITRKYAVLRQDNTSLSNIRRDDLPTADMDDKMGYPTEIFDKMPADGMRKILPGSGAVASVDPDDGMADGVITDISVSSAGTGYEYRHPPRVFITGGGGAGATAEVVVEKDPVNYGGGIGNINITNGGSGYTSPPTVTFAPGHVQKVGDSDDPWDLLPQIIEDTEPSGISQAATAATVAGDHPLGYTGFTSQGDNATAATATITISAAPNAGETVILTDTNGKKVTYVGVDGAGTSPNFQRDTSISNITDALVSAINSSSGHGDTIAAESASAGTVTLTQGIAGAAGNVAITGDAANTGFTGFSGGANAETLTSSLSTLGASGATGPEELKWLRASASVDTSNPGIDLWSCSWVAPVSPFWTTGTTRKSGFRMPVIVDFDSDGPRVSAAGTTTGGAAQTQAVSSFTYFVTGTHLPAAFPAGGGSGSETPIVNIDLRFVDTIGNAFHVTKTYKNALMRLTTSVRLSFKDTSGGTINVAKKAATENIYRFDGDDSTGGGDSSPWKVAPFPLYQNRQLHQVGGVIAWSHTYADAATSGTTFAGASVKSLHSHKGDRVWQVTVHYV